MRIGYIKNFESTSDRENQIKSMTELGVNRIVLEVESNAPGGRQSLIDSINNIEKSDILIVNRLDDLGGSLIDIIDTLRRLEEKGVDLHCINLPNPYDGICDIETRRLLQKQLLSILVWVENKERCDIAKMQAKAVQILKESKEQKGSGRPKKYAIDARKAEDREVFFNVINMLKNGIPIKRISDTLNISRNTIYSIKEGMEKENPSDNA